MSRVELTRAEVCVRIEAGEFSVAEAAVRVGVSYRQMKRLLRRYRKRGSTGLAHGNLGRPSNRSKLLGGVRVRALDLIRAHYSGPPDERFGPKLAAEHLESQHGLKVCTETLRLWMLEAGLWSKSRRRKAYRSRRERRSHFGELVQVDGSFHPWLEARGPKGWLITYIDDSSNKTLARFADSESTWTVAEGLEEWISAYGIPRALYVDLAGVFRTPDIARGEELTKRCGLSQFGRMCKQLEIRIIHARSPQAKGRVERSHGTHQDRLVKKMRLAGISNYTDANRFLENYLVDHNARFSVQPRDEADFHLPLSASIDLSRILSLHSERRVSSDSVVCYQRRRFQLTRTSRSVAGQKVLVEESRDGGVRIFTSGLELSWAEITDSAPKIGDRTTDHNSVYRRPSNNHPWRHPNYDRSIGEEKRRRGQAFQTPPNDNSDLAITT
jgi:transposase